MLQASGRHSRLTSIAIYMRQSPAAQMLVLWQVMLTGKCSDTNAAVLQRQLNPCCQSQAALALSRQRQIQAAAGSAGAAAATVTAAAA